MESEGKGVVVSDLKDTEDLMNSSDYKERFRAEYFQTKIRYEKLKTFNTKIEAALKLKWYNAGEIVEPKHDCPLELLKEQQEAMGRYLHVLELRAIIEDINL